MMPMSSWAPMLIELSSTMTTMTRVQNLFQNGLFMMMKTGVVILVSFLVSTQRERLLNPITSPLTQRGFVLPGPARSLDWNRVCSLYLNLVKPGSKGYGGVEKSHCPTVWIVQFCPVGHICFCLDLSHDCGSYFVHHIWFCLGAGNVWICHLTVTTLPALTSSLSGSFNFTFIEPSLFQFSLPLNLTSSSSHPIALVNCFV